MFLLIKGGTVVNPVGKKGALDILAEDGRIVAMEPNLDPPEDTEVVDATGYLVAPGLVDVHVHFRDPGQTHKENIFTGAKAAGRGGFTSVVMMANTLPPIDSAETLRYCLGRGRSTGIKVYACANVTRGMEGRELTDMEALRYAGAVGFTDDGKPILDEKLAREAMKTAARLGVPISFHEENPRFIETPGFNHGHASEFFGIGGADRLAEISLIERDIDLAIETGATVIFQHVSTAEGIRLIREGKIRGATIHAEATPHHFSLTEEDAIKYGTLAKMNPPLRTEADCQEIILGLQDWTLDLIATDHAPHSPDEKARGLLEAPSGIIGLETSLALGITNLVRPGHLSMNQLIMRMSTNPADVYHLAAGILSEGAAADLVIFNPEEQWRVSDADFASKSRNSPFIGQTLYGKVKYTFSDGRLVYTDQF